MDVVLTRSFSTGRSVRGTRRTSLSIGGVVPFLPWHEIPSKGSVTHSNDCRSTFLKYTITIPLVGEKERSNFVSVWLNKNWRES
jgi:hypothetical protein